MKIVKVNQEFENGTPARVHRPSGTILLAPSFFDHTDIEQDFILGHELGHYVLQTKNEELADWYACKQLVDKHGIKATFRALNNSLFNTNASDKRRLSLFNKLVIYDKLKNNNNMETLQYEQVYDNYTDSMVDVSFSGFDDENGFHYTNDYVCDNDNAPIQELEATDYVNWCRYYGVDMSDADSSKKAQRAEKKAQRAANKQKDKELKQQMKEARIKNVEARADVKSSRADKNRAKAEGIKSGTWQGAGGAIKEGLGKALDTVKGIFGKSEDSGDVMVDENGNPIYAGGESGGKSKILLYVGIGIAVIAVVVVIIIVMKKKK